MQSAIIVYFYICVIDSLEIKLTFDIFDAFQWKKM